MTTLKAVKAKMTYGDLKQKITSTVSKVNGHVPPCAEDIDDEEVWAVINSFQEENGLNAMQIQSFNDFIHNRAQAIIDIPNIKHIHIEVNGKTYDIDLGDLYFMAPRYTEMNGESHVLYPTEALQRSITYGSEIYLDLSFTPSTGETTVCDKQLIGIMPIMVNCDLCNRKAIADNHDELAAHCEDFFDHGGYFIITPKSDKNQGARAQRRVLVAQEEIAKNQSFTFKNRKLAPKYSLYVVCQSIITGAHPTTTTVGRKGDDITCVLPWIDNMEIPIGVVLRAMGVKNEEEMATIILGPRYRDDTEALNILAPVLERAYECNTQEVALLFIGKKGRKFIREDAESAVENSQFSDVIVPDTAMVLDKRDEDRKSAILYAKHLISMEVLSHIGQGEEYTKDKILYLGYMIKKLIWAILDRRRLENRDHTMNKRVNTPGSLLAQQFHGAMRRLVMEISINVTKALTQGNNVNITSWIKTNIITNAMCGAISGNTWNIGGNKPKGIAQIYEQYNHTAGLSNMRKINTPIDLDGGGKKLIEPRDLRGDNFGKKCPAEYPEGVNAGLQSYLGLTCLITIGSDAEPVKKMVAIVLNDEHIHNYPESVIWSRIFINGCPAGMVKDPRAFVKTMINLRRKANLNAQTSISYHADQNEVHISTEAGRMCRPLLIVEDGSLKINVKHIEALVLQEMSWSELMVTGVVELVDASEEESAQVVGYPSDLEALRVTDPIKLMQITHCELHPSMMYGIQGSIIPFSNHNQSPRNTYQSAMGKQAVGIPFTNFKQIMSGTFQTLEYMQKPIALSRAASIIRFDEMPAGQIGMVLVASRAFNEEDSIEINSGSVDRGFMVTNKWVCYYAECRGERFESFGVPTQELCERFRGNPSKLNEEGFTPRGTKVENGDILIGKIVEIRTTGASASSTPDGKKRYINASIKYEHTWPAVVDSIQIGTTGDGYDYIAVMTVQRRKPIVGDKFSSRHGQKGTVSMLVSPQDMPFNSKGMQPDINMNALALPSRMTIAMLIEMWVGKAVHSTSILHEVLVEDFTGDVELFEGYSNDRSKEFTDMFSNPNHPHLVDATPFRKFDRKVIGDEMKKYGASLGDEIFYDGVTGKPLRCLPFYAPCFYQRLRHMSIDKYHARAKGPKTTLTRQPKEGRSYGGGLRTGTMERDVILAQGASRFARDRLMEQSDEFSMWICDKCGIQAHTEQDGKVRECRICETNEVSRVRLPYGAKLVMQEMMAENIVTRILTTPHDPPITGGPVVNEDK